MKKKVRWLWMVVVVSLVGGGVAVGWRSLRGGEAAPAGRVVRVEKGTLVDVASASGTIEPSTQVEVKSRTSGEVVEILVKEGAQVEAGQVLVRLDPTDAERALRDAKNALRRVQADAAQSGASLEAAKLDVEKKKADEGTSLRGSELGLVTDQATRDATFSRRSAEVTVSQRQAALASSSAQLASAKVAVEDAERNLGYTEIVAPIAGTVLNIAVEKGTIVSSALTNVSGGTGIVTLADLEDLRVVGSVDESQIARVAVGQDVTVRVDAYGERSFTGRVDRVASLGATVSNVVTFEVEVVITDDDAHLLQQGMSADLEIVASRKEGATLVPLVAIQTEGGKRFVTTRGGERRALRTGATDGANIEVLEGVAPGEELVIIAAPKAASASTSKKGGMGLGGPPPGMGGPR